jgi:plastocyanin
LPGTPAEHYDGASYINSGIMSKLPAGPDAPPNDTFSLTFDEPGLYPFLCLIHPYMRGVVAVTEATETEVPAQADIDAQIKTEMEGFLAQVDVANAAGATPRGETLAAGSNLWYVDAGSNAGDPSAATFEFLTKELTINTGDTVVWTSHEFHTVTFIPAPPAPEFVVPVPQQDGPPLLTLNAQVITPAKPNQVYDPAEFYNSGLLGPSLPGGSNWSLTFDQPGTYKYFCSVHREQGMEGTIIVKAN